jgi:hypothetical protein
MLGPRSAFSHRLSHRSQTCTPPESGPCPLTIQSTLNRSEPLFQMSRRYLLNICSMIERKPLQRP